MYDITVGGMKIQPSEYRKMSPGEVHRIIDYNRPKTIGNSGLHENDYNDIEDRRAKLEAEGVKVL